MNMTGFQHFKIECDEQGAVTVALDVEGTAVNVFDAEVIAELETIVAELDRATDVGAVVFRSGKSSGFLAGADVSQIAALDDAGDVRKIIARGQQLFNRIEELPMPTVAVIHGPCLGGGLEFALSCRYRIALNDSTTRLGLPEVKLGLLPAWGGTQRLTRLIGPAAALPMMLKGSQLPAGKALRLGLVDLVAERDEFEATVTQFVTQVVEIEPRVMRPRMSVSNWLMNRTRLGRWLVFRTAKKRVARQVRNYPALGEIIEAARIGQARSMSAGLDRERDAFARLLFTPTCRNLLELFFQREQARDVGTWWGDGRPGLDRRETPVERAPGLRKDSSPGHPVVDQLSRIGVVGAGAMGAGIAQLAAYQGFPVVLKEIDEDALSARMARIRGLFDDAVRGGRLSRGEADGRLAAITPTVDWEPLARANLVIEAVVERADVKQQVFAELEQRLDEAALLVSNTSSLSIDELGRSLQRPERLAGLHFFNPVHRMELVEVVRTEKTDTAAVEQLVRLVRKLGKTPVVVNDSPGFLVNRVLFPYLAEAVELVREGVDVVTIDRRMKAFGMPMGPLELLDQIGLDIAVHVAKTMSAVSQTAERTAEFLDEMVAQGNLGRKTGIGFYVYRDDRKERAASNGDLSPDVTQDIQSRLVLPIVNEAARCLEERVVDAAWMVDLAVVLGTGFAPFRGGPLRLADGQGTSRIVEELERLQTAHGARFMPCKLLKEMAGWNASFHDANSRAAECGWDRTLGSTGESTGDSPVDSETTQQFPIGESS